MNQNVTNNQDVSEPVACMQRVQQAINNHDLDALADCFDANYESDFPAHPDRAFVGRTQMRKNWRQIFGAVPDIQAHLIRSAVEGETIWNEWEWKGTRPDGKQFLQRGVTIQGITDGRIQWARLYLEMVEEEGQGSDAAAKRSTTGQADK